MDSKHTPWAVAGPHGQLASIQIGEQVTETWFQKFGDHFQITIKATDEGDRPKIISIRTLITLQYETSLYKVWVLATFDICCQTWLMPLQGPSTTSLFNIVSMGKIGKKMHIFVYYITYRKICPSFWYQNVKVVHNNCLRGILLSAIVTLKSIVSQSFSAVGRGLNRRTDKRWSCYSCLR